MGNPLLDISAHVKPELLQKYDLKQNLACLAEEKHLPIYQELVDNYDVEYIAGGATQNSIRICQWMLNKPQSTAFIGCVGKDEYGKKLRAEAESAHVRVAYMEHDTTPTGTCAVLVTGNERTLVANISAANEYKEDHLSQPEIWDIVDAAKFYYISGFFLTVSPPTIMKVAQHAAEQNKMFCMNLAAPFICEFFKDPLVEASQYWDVIFGNETEAEAFAKAMDFGTTDLHEIAKKMYALPKANTKRNRIVVITHGAEDTIVCTDNKISVFPVDKLAADKIVDTNGAGDAFVGGFFSQLVQDKTIEESVRAGHWAARVIIQHSGATHPVDCDFQ
jgi:adenosine kinase